MKPSERHDLILARTAQGLRIEVEDIARQTGASRETTRRDLAFLDKAGRLRRVHGGALALPLLSAVEDPFNQRLQAQVAAKRAIARHVAAGLKPGDSLFIDTGTTTIYLAEELSRVKGLIIITNSAEIASLAERAEGARVILIGGEFRGAGRESLGAMALAQIGQLHAAEAILTVAAVTPDGAMDIDPQEAEIARAMARQSSRVTILADSSKMGRPGVFAVAPLDEVSRIVTDAMPQALRRAVEAAGAKVEIARL